MDNLTANANDVIDVLLDRSKNQERDIAILQVNLANEVKKNKSLQSQLDEAKAKLAQNDQDLKTEQDPQANK
ncbi:hypothetical protein LMB75_05735 [Limosilactobacillus reuteri]|uniref:hypothetical protein n=1 Tax=Limosilactobacillus reuteri TaxID=1598 RepID=UPI001E5994C8|nr:hypothetical protein [Limosilactobacillus reuteri]MCC4405595.1 hypothetical protein [Limosilactobacillus reuteri]